MDLVRAPSGGGATCPDCHLELEAAPSGPIVARRCGGCRGIWLDPVSFQRVCEDETPADASRDATTCASGAGAVGRAHGPEERVRYRGCPECGEVMDRRNFARVSGVVIDVCRPHGAWFDRGELGAIRRFLREGGLERHRRWRNLEREVGGPAAPGAPMPSASPSRDIYDVLVGGDGGWDLPSRIPRALVAVACTAFGAWALWDVFFGGRTGFRPRAVAGGVLMGLASLYLAARALADRARRRR